MTISVLKPSHIPTMIELLTQGAKDKPIPITTVELSKKLGKSQQLASKHLDEMEREGLVERIRSSGKTYVKLTEKGVLEATSLYKTLESALEKEEQQVELSGNVFSGLGEGAYYVSMNGYRRQFISKLGFDPYPGTVNLRLTSAIHRKIRRDLSTAKGVHIEGFDDGKRTYGGAECFRSLLNGNVEAAVLVLERTSHDDSVIEIISPVNVRQYFHLKEGDPINVTVFMNNSDISK